MTKKLVVKSVENEDWNGTWLKGEVEQEMRELNQTPTGNDWLYWVTGHLFDCKEFDGTIEKFICECENIVDLTLRFDDGEVTIKKF